MLFSRTTFAGRKQAEGAVVFVKVPECYFCSSLCRAGVCRLSDLLRPLFTCKLTLKSLIVQSFHTHQPHRVAKSGKNFSLSTLAPRIIRSAIVMPPQATIAEPCTPIRIEPTRTRTKSTIELLISTTPTSSNASSTTLVNSETSSTSSLPVSLPELVSFPLDITYCLPAEKLDEKPFRLLRHAIFSVYRRLFCLVVIANLIGLVFIDYRRRDNNSYIRVSLSPIPKARSLLTIQLRLSRVLHLETCSWLLPCVKITLSISSMRSSPPPRRAHHSVSDEFLPKFSNLAGFTLVLPPAPLSGLFDSPYTSL